MKFTKGEWKIARKQGSIKGLSPILGIKTKAGEWVALLGSDNVHLGNAEANADLIAAAPVLYRCLRDLTEWLENDKALVGNIEKLKSDCLYALAKAEGKEGG